MAKVASEESEAGIAGKHLFELAAASREVEAFAAQLPPLVVPAVRFRARDLICHT